MKNINIPTLIAAGALCAVIVWASNNVDPVEEVIG